MNEPERKRKPILVLDFDGVLHAYTSGWQGIEVIPDGPTPGAMDFLREAVKHFDVNIYSSRSHDRRGHQAMVLAIQHWLADAFGFDEMARLMLWSEDRIHFPTHKPAAFVTIDDRAVTFTGTFPAVDELLAFRPWTQREAAS